MIYPECFIIMSVDGVFLDVLYDIKELDSWFNFNKMFDFVYIYKIDSVHLTAHYWDMRFK